MRCKVVGLHRRTHSYYGLHWVHWVMMTTTTTKVWYTIRVNKLTTTEKNNGICECSLTTPKRRNKGKKSGRRITRRKRNARGFGAAWRVRERTKHRNTRIWYEGIRRRRTIHNKIHGFELRRTTAAADAMNQNQKVHRWMNFLLLLFDVLGVLCNGKSVNALCVP